MGTAAGVAVVPPGTVAVAAAATAAPLFKSPPRSPHVAGGRPAPRSPLLDGSGGGVALDGIFLLGPLRLDKCTPWRALPARVPSLAVTPSSAATTVGPLPRPPTSSTCHCTAMLPNSQLNWPRDERAPPNSASRRSLRSSPAPLPHPSPQQPPLLRRPARPAVTRGRAFPASLAASSPPPQQPW